jgi:hypothetical protein
MILDTNKKMFVPKQILIGYEDLSAIKYVGGKIDPI